MKAKRIMARAWELLKRLLNWLWELLKRLLAWKHVVEKEKVIDIGYTEKVVKVTVPIGLIIVFFLLLGGGAIHHALREHYQVAQGVIAELGLEKSGTRVVMALDGSDSMRGLYESETVQNTANRVLALALALSGDDAPVYYFSDQARKAGELNQDNFLRFIEKHPPDFMGTNYAGVLGLIHEEASSRKPTLVLFVTDGDNHDAGDTRDVLQTFGEKKIFVLFVGLDFNPANVDEFSRGMDNVAAIQVDDIDQIGDPALYRRCLKPYATWYHKKR